MLRYLTYSILAVIVVAAIAGFANATDYRACSSYATYSYSANDCVYLSNYNNMALQWRNQNPYASQYDNPYSKYQNWYDSNGNYHAYDTAPRDTGYTFRGQDYGGYAAYERVYGASSGYGTYGSDGATQYGSSSVSYGAISPQSASGSGYGNTYIRDSYNTNNYYGSSNTYASASSGYDYGTGSSGCSYGGYGCSGYGYAPYNYGAYSSGCAYGGYGCSGYGYAPYNYYTYGYSSGSPPSYYLAYWSSR